MTALEQYQADLRDRAEGHQKDAADQRQAALKFKGAARVAKLHKAEVNEAQARAYENAALLANALQPAMRG